MAAGQFLPAEEKKSEERDSLVINAEGQDKIINHKALSSSTGRRALWWGPVVDANEPS